MFYIHLLSLHGIPDIFILCLIEVMKRFSSMLYL